MNGLAVAGLSGKNAAVGRSLTAGRRERRFQRLARVFLAFVWQKHRSPL